MFKGVCTKKKIPFIAFIIAVIVYLRRKWLNKTWQKAGSDAVTSLKTKCCSPSEHTLLINRDFWTWTITSKTSNNAVRFEPGQYWREYYWKHRAEKMGDTLWSHFSWESKLQLRSLGRISQRDVSGLCWWPLCTRSRALHSKLEYPSRNSDIFNTVRTHPDAYLSSFKKSVTVPEAEVMCFSQLERFEIEHIKASKLINIASRLILGCMCLTFTLF